MTELLEQEVVCQLLWKLARRHGWSQWISLDALVRDLSVQDERRAREIFEAQVAKKEYVEYHPGREEVKLNVPHENLAYDLRDDCGFSELRIEATLSHFDGF